MSENAVLKATSSSSDETFRPLIEMVVASVAAPSTKDRYARKLRLFFQWWEASGRAPFSRHLVNTYLAAEKDRGAQAFDIGHSLTAIKRLAREAAYAGLVDAINLDAILQIKAPPVQGLRMGQWLTSEEVLKLMDLPDRATLTGKRDVVILGLMLYCGLRREEVLRVGFEHVKIVDGRPALVNLRGKGDKLRSIPMPIWLFRALQVWVDAAGLTDGLIVRALMGHNPKAPTGKTLNKVCLWHVVKRYARKMGKDDLSPHDMRRTFGRLARKAGIELDQIQQSYGHANLITTQRYIGGTLDFQNAPCDALPVPAGYREPTTA